MNKFAQKIEELVSVGWNIEDYKAYRSWVDHVSSLLSTAIDIQVANKFENLGGTFLDWEARKVKQIGHLEGLALKLDATNQEQSKTNLTFSASTSSSNKSTKRVFIVHGHDSATKEAAARFIERIGLEPIILHEQANEGRTVIEKFEAYADVGFAIVLMTPDDVGAGSKKKNKLLPRARQNVILELGYFTGRLGRSKVCALFKPGIEVPSDIHGVLFVELDESGAWKTKLANELVRAGMKVDVQALLQG
ncbi:TIR domain-containing protein [candidate division KSB1 bacterium]